jgi:quercetin dioxygenase-like cupin family protein
MTFTNLNQTPEKEVVPGYHARFIHTENMTLAYWRVEAGAQLPEHSHPHEQVANVLEGQFELTVGGEARRMGPGEAAYIPGGIPHSGVAISECRLIDVFSPVREDYR